MKNYFLLIDFSQLFIRILFSDSLKFMQEENGQIFIFISKAHCAHDAQSIDMLIIAQSLQQHSLLF